MAKAKRGHDRKLAEDRQEDAVFEHKDIWLLRRAAIEGDSSVDEFEDAESSGDEF